MLCLICLRAEATIHVLDWPPDNPRVESHYCAACYERAYAGRSIGRVVEDDVPPSFLFRPRFTIRHLMIAAGLSALVDAFLVLFIRLCIPGTPAEIAEWTMRAVLFGNVFCAAAIAMILSFRWLARWHWYATTGRWVTFSQIMREARLMQQAGIPSYLSRAFEDELERAILWSFLWVYRWHQYATTGRWLTLEELIPESWRLEGIRVPNHPRLASAGEWFFWALSVAWLLLWIYGLDPNWVPAWIHSCVPRYGIEAVFTYILILPAVELLIYFGMVAAALRRSARGCPEAEPPRRIPEETGNDLPGRRTHTG